VKRKHKVPPKSQQHAMTSIKAKAKKAVVGREMYGGGAPAMEKMKSSRMHRHGMRYSGR
jgi:hypothetical protein